MRKATGNGPIFVLMRPVTDELMIPSGPSRSTKLSPWSAMYTAIVAATGVNLPYLMRKPFTVPVIVAARSIRTTPRRIWLNALSLPM